jgi:hypothetical protein
MIAIPDDSISGRHVKSLELTYKIFDKDCSLTILEIYSCSMLAFLEHG